MPNLPPDAIAALQRGQLVEAIKRTREATGMGLKEAKEAVERYADGNDEFAVQDDAFEPLAEDRHTPIGPLPPAAHAALQRGQVVEAVKLTREATGLGLAEAKQLVDAARARAPEDGSVPGLASAGALFDPMHEPGRVSGGGASRWVALVVVLLCLLAGAWFLFARG